MAVKAASQIDGDIKTVEQFGKKIDEATTEPVIEQMQTIKRTVEHERAAFEAKIERLNSPYVLSPELEKVLKVSRIVDTRG